MGGGEEFVPSELNLQKASMRRREKLNIDSKWRLAAGEEGGGADK